LSLRLPLLPFLVAFAGLLSSATRPGDEWPFYGGDQAGSRYSSLTQINKSNVKNLKPAWTWKSGEKPMPEYGTSPGMFEATPLMIGGVLYFSTPYNRVIALDPATGNQLWVYDPEAYKGGQVPNGTGFVHRGVAAWLDSSGGGLRILLNSRDHLIELDAKTGKPVAGFGDNGIVNLLVGLPWEVNPAHYTNTSPAVIYRDLIILGNGVADRLVYPKDPPGDVRAYNARTGKLVWTFHTVPHDGEFGSDTWENGSNNYTGHTNVWAPFTLDQARGLVYLPVSTPSNDNYGGRRLGAGLFADTLVCLDAATGQRKWHYQLVHHGLWDYDMPGPPSLVHITMDGKGIDAVVQLTKQGYAYVFDRVTGKPVWPIKEEPVPDTDVPGEKAWPTQPIPSKPPPLTPQGVSEADAFDLTPELKTRALAELAKMRTGPLFTPPSLRGTIMRPGTIGGADWAGGAFDPETGVLYVKVNNAASLVRPRIPDKDGNIAPGRGGANGPTGSLFIGTDIPVLKPPYGLLDAVNLNKGEMLWQEPFGDDEHIRNSPDLKGVKLPDRLGVVGDAGVIVTKGGLVFAGGGDKALHAVDKTTGKELWSSPTPRTNGTPMTYSVGGKQYIVVATGGAGTEPELRAFAF
jgi:quinoprotein glucose dehydrogenase